MDSDDYLNRLLPHRLDALELAILMLNLRLRWGGPRPMKVCVDGMLQFDGSTNMLTNPTFEVGVLHARALLEFVGLRVDNDRLVQLKPGSRKPDDAAIEKLTGPTGALPLVTPEQAAAIHPDGPESARQVFIRVITAANKGVAHSSATYFSDPAAAPEILLAFNLTQRLVERFVYLPMGRQRPPTPIEGRNRE